MANQRAQLIFAKLENREVLLPGQVGALTRLQEPPLRAKWARPASTCIGKKLMGGPFCEAIGVFIFLKTGPSLLLR